MPPSVARFDVDVSGPKPSPKRFAARLRSSCTTPGCTRTRTCVGVDLVDDVHVVREVEHQPAPACCLAGQARAAAARDDRHTETRGDAAPRRDVVRVARERHRERLDREHAGVGREQVARVVVARRTSPASSRSSAVASSSMLVK